VREQALFALLRFFSWLPLSLCHRIGALIGTCAFWLPNPVKAVAQKNLEICFPTLSTAQRKRLLLRSLQETGKTICEMGAMWYWPKDKILGLVQSVEGQEIAQACWEQQRGLILATPHLGSWELSGLYCSHHWPMTILYKPPRLKRTEDFIQTARGKMGANVVPTTARGMIALQRALKKHLAIGVLPDQEPGEGNGVFAPFFQFPAYSMTMLPRLAHKTGAPVVFVFAKRLAKGKGFCMQFVSADHAIAHADPVAAATALNLTIQRCVELAPEQYQWGYKRFRSRPNHEPRFY